MSEINLTKKEAAAMVDWFDNSFLSCLQEPCGGLKDMEWVTNMCSVYNKLKNFLDSEHNGIDTNNNMCYNTMDEQHYAKCSLYQDAMKSNGDIIGTCWSNGPGDVYECDCDGDISRCECK